MRSSPLWLLLLLLLLRRSAMTPSEAWNGGVEASPWGQRPRIMAMCEGEACEEGLTRREISSEPGTSFDVALLATLGVLLPTFLAFEEPCCVRETGVPDSQLTKVVFFLSGQEAAPPLAVPELPAIEPEPSGAEGLA